MNRFNSGDIITAKEYSKGLEKATVIKYTGDKCYLKIVNGIAVIPSKVVNENYKLLE